MAGSIEDRLTVIMPIPTDVAELLGLEFTVGKEAVIYGENPDDPDGEPTITLDAFASKLSVVKISGDGPVLVEILHHLAEEAERAWKREQERRAAT
jgi:hypothetical protein